MMFHVESPLDKIESRLLFEFYHFEALALHYMTDEKANCEIAKVL